MIDYENLLTDTVKNIKPSGIRKFFDVAERIPDAIALGVGEPDFKTPWNIRQAAIEALSKGQTRYSANAGLTPLREEIARYMERRFTLKYDPASEVIVTVGGSEAIDNIIRSVISVGDEVLIPEPSFVCYAPLTELAGGKPIILPTYEKDDFKLMPETVKAAITEKTKLLIMPYPNNPTGALMEKEDYEKIAAVIKDTNILVLSDEIYIELNYSKSKPFSFAQTEGMFDRTIVVNGFSKTYAMTGWRIGFACGPKPIMKAALKIHQYGIMCAPTVSQYAAIEALKNGDEDIENMREHYNMRRRFLLDSFEALNVPCFEPKGAFYVFPNISEFAESSEAFCNDFLEKAHVAVVPGNAFGDSGEGFIRISYAYSLDHLKKAIERLEKYIKR
ncbi:MAG: aminotransferase class I/II-fold pyridoxal phosphate-dependent enzyme [Ruminococcaceae bacterium]|nr:aminotransferase class I/II-fold pyridoxal phosphate-dependent enzyme [Oscillospiraceae bacterium]